MFKLDSEKIIILLQNRGKKWTIQFEHHQKKVKKEKTTAIKQPLVSLNYILSLTIFLLGFRITIVQVSHRCFFEGHQTNRTNSKKKNL